MDLNHRKIISVMGVLLLVLGLLLLVPAAVGIVHKEDTSSLAFVKTAFVCFVIGTVLTVTIKPKKDDLKIRDGLLVASLAWFTLSLAGCIPFLIDGCIPTFADAFFESCSGFSTTGSTILKDVTVLPMCMLFWRSFSHWIGGMGILVLTVAILPALGNAGQTIVRYESPGPVLTKIAPKAKDTSRLLYFIYGSLTVLETIFLKLGGMNLFDAVTHTFATVGTGGFSTYNESITAFSSPYIETVITIFMILAGINFSLYFLLITGRIHDVLVDSELKLYLLVIFITTILITMGLYISGTYSSLVTAFRYSAFQVASLITTTGFATADYELWPSVCKALLLLLFVIGGSSSSTSGGIKVIRVFVLLKLIKRAIAVRLHPNALYSIKVNKETVPKTIIDNICSFAFLYFITLFCVAFLVAFDGNSFMTNFSAAATCLGNIGPGFDSIGPSLNFSQFSPAVKIILSVTMIAGRLELYSLFLLFTPGFWNPKH